MTQVLIRDNMAPGEIKSLQNEFPECKFLVESTDGLLEKQQWESVEILYGSQLHAKEFHQARQLRWIHSPVPYLADLHLGEYTQHQGLLITNTKGQNLVQVGEYVLGGVLAFAKQFFHWRELQGSARSPWESPPEHDIWSLEDRTLLQVGLGMVGSEVARVMQGVGMRVWGVRERASFHPHCDKVYAEKDLHALLPAADVVVLALPRGRKYKDWFGAEELRLLKAGSILVIVGAGGAISETALAKEAGSGRLRGVIMDSFAAAPIGKNSPLWRVPNILLTPEVAPQPLKQTQLPFRTFRFNLRQFIHGNYFDMKNLVSDSV